MPEFVVDRDRIRALIDHGAEVVEVLPRPEYEYAHLPGAVHVPLKSFDPSDLDPRRSTIVYCNNFL